MTKIEPAYSTHLRHVAIEAVMSVQDQLLAAFRSPMQRGFKRDHRDIVTIHDKAAEKRIVEVLQKNEPNSVVIGEEHGLQGSGKLKWYVDPIDGTANFARGLASWCVSVGAVYEDDIVAGAILDPVGGNLFSADLSGAYLGENAIISQAEGQEEDATLISTYPSARDIQQDGRARALDRFGQLVETFSSVRRNGSAALGIAHVAAGWSDAAAGFSVNAWDVTAAILILRQSGGSYQAFPEGSDAPHHLSAYTAVGAGGSYPTLKGIAEQISSGRT
ncbi:MAG: inositol monophosphatase [Rhodospirillales bacterium]|jgi:myo-inositol-1(or 4)-monophosphatase|nr:inositol monophosphatase [Rhodospirillales bacterium]